jgi:hypothetical protein
MTPLGKKQLVDEQAKWNHFVAAIASVMEGE